MSAAKASVVIPAHNEAAGLRRGLTTLLQDAEPGEFEIVVVANGCTDDTADVARAFSADGVRCVETLVPSKIGALNLGDDHVSVFPRLYLDADVIVDTAAAREVVAVLASGSALAAAPRVSFDTSRSNLLARRYTRVLQSLPVFENGYVGSGCYGLSAAGRATFGRFPDVIGDDKYVNDLFEQDQKRTLGSQRLTVVGPTSLRAIIRRSLRVRAGSAALAAAATPSARRSVSPASTSTSAYLLALARKPKRLPDVLIFASTQVIVAVLSGIRRRKGNDQDWIRDESSRNAA